MKSKSYLLSFAKTKGSIAAALVAVLILTSSLKKHTFYNLLINNILYLCVT